MINEYLQVGLFSFLLKGFFHRQRAGSHRPDRLHQTGYNQLRFGTRRWLGRGEFGQCQVCHFNGAQDRRPCLRPSRRHYRSEANNGSDRLLDPHGQGLRSQYG